MPGALLVQDGKMTSRQRQALNKLIFRVQDRIVDLMSEYRAEWRKQYAQSLNNFPSGTLQ